MIPFLRTLNEILTAGIAITAFSLLLYALTFNLRVRVARSFALILIALVIIFAADSIGSVMSERPVQEFFLRLQWIGVVLLPAAYLHFSDALLVTTGKPSRGRRKLAIRLVYAASVVFALGLAMFPSRFAPATYGSGTVLFLQPTLYTNLFLLFSGINFLVAWINFLRAYQRTTSTASRRRMLYLILGAVAPVLGAFPFLPYSPNFAASHQSLFISLSVLANIFVGTLIVVMAYAVAFFGVSWPERVVKTRLLKWILRGPLTASLTLAAVTLTRRAGEVFGLSSYNALVPIVMVSVVLLSEHLITILSPLGERVFFYGRDRGDLDMLRRLENQILTRNDLLQFLEMLLASARDLLQSPGAYIAAQGQEGLELVLTSGETRFRMDEEAPTYVNDAEMTAQITRQAETEPYHWGEDILYPLLNGAPEQPELMGFLGISQVADKPLDADTVIALRTITERAKMALQNRRIQTNVFAALETLSSGASALQRLRAAGQYDRAGLLEEDLSDLQGEPGLTSWVKDALTHYWGGPKLTQNPLMQFQIVQEELQKNEGNSANALRAILRAAIERVRPEGERRFTGEWILYNILEMKFLEGKKVREVALRLAVSEADLYRKQRVAIEAVARAISEMELQARKEASH